MAHIWADRTAETTTTTGTGALTLAGAITGYRAFSAVCSTNDTVTYAIEAVDSSGVPTGAWELGVGTYSGVNTLTRTTVLKSSNADAAVSFAAGTKNVFLDDIASTRNTLEQFSGTTEPAAPTAGLISFAKDFNGWPVPYARGSANRSGALEGYLSGRPFFARVLPFPGSTTLHPLGAGFTLTGTAAGAGIANTNAVTRFARSAVTTTATASTAAGYRDGNGAIFARGTHALDGFRVVMRFCLETIGNTNCRWFVGLLNSSGALAATFDPATTGQIEIGIGATATDTANMKLYYNDNAGAPSTVDLGANYPAKTAYGAFVELILWAESSASTIKYQVRRLDDLTIAPTTGSLSTDIPAAATQLNAHWHINNNGTATASLLAFGGYYIETGI